MTREEYEERKRIRDDMREKLIEEAKGINLVGLLSHLGYTVVRKGRHHSTQEKDSLMIYDSSTWYRWSTHTGGDAIKWMTDEEHYSFNEAVEYLLQLQNHRLNEEERICLFGEEHHYRKRDVILRNGETIENFVKKEKAAPEEKGEFILPNRAAKQNRLFGYLVNGRGISYDTVKFFYKTGNIYLSENNNAVFVSKDSSGRPRHAFQRGTMNSSFKCDVKWNDKDYGFNLYRGGSDTVVVTEAAIDLMSYYDITKDDCSSLLALGMTDDRPLVRYLEEHPDIKHIKLLLDADEPGRRFTDVYIGKYQSEEWASKGYSVEDIQSPVMEKIGCKDVNDLLRYMTAHPGEIINPYAFETIPAQIKQTTKPEVKAPPENPGQSGQSHSDFIKDICLQTLYQIYDRMSLMETENVQDQTAWSTIIDAGGALYGLAERCGWDFVDINQYKAAPTALGQDQQSHVADKKKSL